MPAPAGEQQSQKEIEKERKQEEKERKALLKAQNKILDEKDEMFCGFLNVTTLDGDGIQKVIKGTYASNVPLHCKQEGDKVLLAAQMPTDKIRTVMLNNDGNLYLNVTAWYAGEKAGATNTIGTALEKCSTLAEAAESGGSGSMKMSLPFLADGTQGACKVVAKEERFQTKITQIVIELSKAQWMAWKQYRLRFWTQGKIWGADGKPSGGDDKDDDDKDKDKDGEKKEE